MSFCESFLISTVFDYLVICLKRTACYFMQLQGRLEWLLSNSPPLSAHHVLVRIFNLSNEACVPMNKDDEKRDRGERTSKSVPRHMTIIKQH